MDPLAYREPPEESSATAASASPVPAGARRDAVIDLGSNSIRLLISQVDAEGRIQILNCVKSMVKLGEGAFESRALQPEAMDRTIAVLKTFAQTSRAYGAGKIVAVATASVREAGNGREFTDLVRQTTGIVFNVISGPEEARLIAFGVESSLPRSFSPRVYMDIGGGSTEFAVSRNHEILDAESLRVGCVRLADLFFKGDTGRVSRERFQALCDYIRDKAVMPFIRVRSRRPVEIVASSGTASAIADIAAAFPGSVDTRNSAGLRTVSLENVRRVAEIVCSKSAEERSSIPGMSQRRISVIIPGVAIFLTAMEELGFESITITDRGLRDGVLLQHLENEGLIPGGSEAERNLREKSVRALGMTFSVEVAHAETVTRLAASLFDQAVAMDLVDLSQRWRDMIRYAALLEETGIAISYMRHSSHSAYIVANADILGFTLQETQTIAAVIFLASNSVKEKPSYLDVSPGEWWNAAKAGFLLKIAENLDKSHRGAVTKAEFLREDGALKLCVSASSPSPVERDSINRVMKDAPRVFGGSVAIEWVIDPAVSG